MVRILPALVEHVPEYEVRNGTIYVNCGGDIQFAIPVHVWLAGVARGEAAIARWHLAELDKGASNVVRLGAS